MVSTSPSSQARQPSGLAMARFSTAQDYDELYRDGAAAIFGPGTPIATAAIKILEILLAE